MHYNKKPVHQLPRTSVNVVVVAHIQSSKANPIHFRLSLHQIYYTNIACELLLIAVEYYNVNAEDLWCVRVLQSAATSQMVDDLPDRLTMFHDHCPMFCFGRRKGA